MALETAFGILETTETKPGKATLTAQLTPLLFQKGHF